MDPSFWQAFQTWEKQASEAWSSMIQSPEFVDLMNQQMESWLLLKQGMDRAAEESLKAALLPSRVEQERILSLVHKLQVQVEDLSDRLETVSQLVE